MWWGDVMRGVAILFSYLIGLAAIISVGIVGVMAVQSSIKSTPVPSAATASPKGSVKQAAVAQKDAQPSPKRKASHVAHKRKKEEAPTAAPSGFNAYGYAAEPRRMYQYPAPFFGR
jgi:predicted lipid-binding transport protein (Tim44 family)